MLYMIYAEDKADSVEGRKKARPAHIDRLKALQDAGRLVMAGPIPIRDKDENLEFGVFGSLIVAEFSSLDDASSWAAADPYVKANVYENVTIKPYKRVL